VRGALAAAALVALLASASAAPARTAKLTKAENHWAVPVVNLMKSLSGRIGAVGNQVSDKTLLTKGSRAQLKLAVTLANLIACAGKLKQDGPPPTARLKPFATSMSSACSHYVAGSHLLAKGVGKATTGHSAADVKLGTSLITKAVGELRRGSTSLGRAQAQLVALTR
jgi:hypothetical protein